MSGRAVVRHFESDRIAESSVRELAFERPPEVVDVFFVHKEIAVPRHTKLVTAGHMHAGKELVDEGMDDRGQEGEIVRPGGASSG